MHYASETIYWVPLGLAVIALLECICWHEVSIFTEHVCLFVRQHHRSFRYAIYGLRSGRAISAPRWLVNYAPTQNECR